MVDQGSPEQESPEQEANRARPRATLRDYRMPLRTYRRVAIVALLLLCAIVVTGVSVRLTGSGLGCSAWPNCESGDFIKIGDPNQAIEQLNRLFTGLVSLGVAAAVLGALRLRERRRDLTWLSLGLVAGVIAQIVLWGITVLVDLHPAAVAGHFFLSMVLVVDATLLVWRAGQPGGAVRPAVAEVQVRANWVAMAAGAIVLSVTGPLVTGSGPHAGDGSARRFSVAIPDAARIHSLSAWVFCALVVGVLVMLYRSGAPGDVLRRGQVLLAVIVAQGAVGYFQYNLGIPAWLVLLHVVGATSIAIAGTWFTAGLFTPASPRRTAASVGRSSVSS
ncbi:MAG: COX15/CtaA family protein [Microthrixaceae bacterium]